MKVAIPSWLSYGINILISSNIFIWLLINHIFLAYHVFLLIITQTLNYYTNINLFCWDYTNSCCYNRLIDHPSWLISLLSILASLFSCLVINVYYFYGSQGTWRNDKEFEIYTVSLEFESRRASFIKTWYSRCFTWSTRPF